MNDGTRSYVRSLAIDAGALVRCPHCGEPHLSAGNETLIENCIATVEASRVQGDLRLFGMADVGAYVRAIVSESETRCEVEQGRRH